jgi:hypothetical protein
MSRKEGKPMKKLAMNWDFCKYGKSQMRKALESIRLFLKVMMGFYDKLNNTTSRITSIVIFDLFKKNKRCKIITKHCNLNAYDN